MSDVFQSDGSEAQMSLAWMRFWARLIDGVAGFFLMLVGSRLTGLIQADVGAFLAESDALWAVLAIASITTAALTCVFTAICLSVAGTTPGKALLGVVLNPADPTGAAPSFVLRELRAFAQGLGLGLAPLALFTALRQKRRLDDGLPATYDEGRTLVSARPGARPRYTIAFILTALLVTQVPDLLEILKNQYRRLSPPQTFHNSVTGQDVLLPVEWRLSTTVSDGQNPLFVFEASSNDMVAFGLELLHDPSAEASDYAWAVIDTLEQTADPEMQVAFDGDCDGEMVGVTATLRCPGWTVVGERHVELLVFVDQPRAWRILSIKGDGTISDMPARDALVEALISTTK